MMTPWFQVVGHLFLLLGTIFCAVSVIGVLRFPDVYARLHASTKALSGGAVFLLMGAAILYGSPWVALRLVLIAAFLLVTNPIATHAIARAAHRHGIKPSTLLVDQYEAHLKSEETDA